jgi:hypothetical protein
MTKGTTRRERKYRKKAVSVCKITSTSSNSNATANNPNGNNQEHGLLASTTNTRTSTGTPSGSQHNHNSNPFSSPQPQINKVCYFVGEEKENFIVFRQHRILHVFQSQLQNFFHLFLKHLVLIYQRKSMEIVH